MTVLPGVIIWITLVVACCVLAKPEVYDENKFEGKELEQKGTYRTSYGNFRDAWNKYKSEHGLRFSGREHYERLSSFRKRLKQLEAHNKAFQAGNVSYYVGLNDFSHLSEEEKLLLKGIFQPLMSGRGGRDSACTVMSPNTTGIPNEMFWETKGSVNTPVNQGTCGSCYSFAAIGAVETAWFKATGKLLSLSTQQMVDCSGEFKNFGCNGGFPSNVYEYILKSNGVALSTRYRYTGRQSKCKYSQKLRAATISKCYYLYPGKDEELLRGAVGHYGPVSVGIDSSRIGFLYYKGGVYDDPDCSDISIDHAVLVTGYGMKDSSPVWSVKNSWGKGWGENGFIYMKRNKNLCGISNIGSFPYVDPKDAASVQYNNLRFAPAAAPRSLCSVLVSVTSLLSLFICL